MECSLFFDQLPFRLSRLFIGVLLCGCAPWPSARMVNLTPGPEAARNIERVKSRRRLALRSRLGQDPQPIMPVANSLDLVTRLRVLAGHPGSLSHMYSCNRCGKHPTSWNRPRARKGEEGACDARTHAVLRRFPSVPSAPTPELRLLSRVFCRQPSRYASELQIPDKTLSSYKPPCPYSPSELSLAPCNQVAPLVRQGPECRAPPPCSSYLSCTYLFARYILHITYTCKQ